MIQILIISDNNFISRNIRKIVEQGERKLVAKASIVSTTADPASYNNLLENGKYTINLKNEKNIDFIVKNYDLVISAHCKQLFPLSLVNNIRCINIHPGLNPFNRGWYPQVFSIQNGLPIGCTIHEIDEFLDHGPIIGQTEIEIQPDDTSLSLYNRIIEEELSLFDQLFEEIVNNAYETSIPVSEGNLNLRSDFDALCALNLESVDTLRNHINLLRALTHGDYRNAYFSVNGEKIFVKLTLYKDE